MISLPTLPSANAEKPVKTAGFAGLDRAFASILDGETDPATGKGGKILPEGGKDLPGGKALQAVRKSLHGHAKPETETPGAGEETSELAVEGETAEVPHKGAEILEAIALAIDTPVKFHLPHGHTPRGALPKDAPVSIPRPKGPTLELTLTPIKPAPEAALQAADIKPVRHAPVHAAQALLAALRQTGTGTAKPAANEAIAPEQAVAAAVVEAAQEITQEAVRPAKAPRPQPRREVTLELVKDTKPANPATPRSALSNVLPLTPAAQPVAADAAPQTVKTAPEIASAPHAIRPHEFATLVDRLVEAREAARPADAKLTVMHADFGQVSLRFGHDDGNLTVSMASNDPGFAPAVTAAARTADASNGDASFHGRRDDGSQASRGAADTSTNGGERGRDGAERSAREDRIRQQPHHAAQRGGDKPQDGIFA